MGGIILDVIQLLDWVGKIRFRCRNTLAGKVGELLDAVAKHEIDRFFKKNSVSRLWACSSVQEHTQYLC